MKVLILTMTCGEGHNSIAKAVKEAFENSGDEISLINIYRSNKKLYSINEKGYGFCKKYIPHIYEKVWLSFKKRAPEKRDTAAVHKYVKKVQKDIFTEIESYQPDAIVCTHYYASTIVSDYIKINKLNAKSYAILTDFLPHPFWEASIYVDYVISPNSFSHEQLLKKGFSEGQIKELGLPIQKKFSTGLLRAEARKELSLNDDLFTMLLFNDRSSRKPLKVLKALVKYYPNDRVINLCNGDKKLYKKVNRYCARKKTKNVINIVFSNDVEIVMHASDIIITKAGCATLCEGLASGVPMLIREKMTLNERENKQLLLKNNAALGFENIKEMCACIDRLKSDKALYNSCIENATKIAKKNAARDLADFVKSNA